MGVTSKNPKPSYPSFISAPFAIRLGEVATSVVMPLIIPANASGIISFEGGMPRRLQMLRVTGMKIATTPVVLITDPSRATEHISMAIRAASDFPERRSIQSPPAAETPVLASPELIANIRAIIMTLESENAANASSGFTIPDIMRITNAHVATASMRGLPATNAATHAQSSASTNASSRFISVNGGVVISKCAKLSGISTHKKRLRSAFRNFRREKRANAPFER